MTNLDKKESNKKSDLFIKIVLIIIIILLLIHNCVLVKKRKENGNVDIIDINCNSNQCNPIKEEINNISFSADNVSVVAGEKLPLIVVIDPTSLSNTKLSWISSNPNIVSVDENGVITGLKEGSAIITVTSPNGKTATCNVTVTKKAVNVKKINLSANKLTVKVGSIKQLIATVEPSNATNRELVFSSNDPSIARVNSKGVITGLKEGTVTITVKTKDGKVVAKSTVKVEKKQKSTSIDSLSFNEDNVSVKKGDSLNLVAVVKPSELSSSKLTWTSSDSSIVTVDENGKITGIKEGTATITVKSSNGKTAKCSVTVTANTIAVEEIVLDPEDVNLIVGETIQVTSRVVPENATNRELVWTSNDSSVVTVDDSGVIKGVKVGTTTITVKTKDGTVTSTINVTVADDSTVKVFDEDKPPIEWNGASDLKIFSRSFYDLEDVIAPESSNTYKFVVRNSTGMKIKYNVYFHETNNYEINMKYMLKKNDTYIIDTYSKADDLDIYNYVLNPGEVDTYYLDWKWISSDNDTSIGQKPEANYGLRIEVEAESINE